MNSQNFSDPIKVILADDHPLIRDGINAFIVSESDLVIVGQASNGDELRSIVNENKADILLLDLNMPGSSTRDTIIFIKEKQPSINIIILTAHDDDISIRTFLPLGIRGYILKDDATETLVSAIRTVHQGGTCFSKRVFEKLIKICPTQKDATLFITLTDQEQIVLRLIKEGMTNKEIAHKTNISERTVRYYTENILQKLHVRNRIEAVSKAMQNSLFF
jgi:DNA-binding NarL/FixJ family response regulator